MGRGKENGKIILKINLKNGIKNVLTALCLKIQDFL